MILESLPYFAAFICGMTFMLFAVSVIEWWESRS